MLGTQKWYVQRSPIGCVLQQGHLQENYNLCAYHVPSLSGDAEFGPQWDELPQGQPAPAGCWTGLLPRCGAGPCGGFLLCGWGYGQRGQPGGPRHRVVLWGVWPR